ARRIGSNKRRHASTPSRSGQYASPLWHHGLPRSCATAWLYTWVWRPLCPVPTYCGEGRRSPGRRGGLVEKPLSLLHMVSMDKAIFIVLGSTTGRWHIPTYWRGAEIFGYRD